LLGFLGRVLKITRVNFKGILDQKFVLESGRCDRKLIVKFNDLSKSGL
jgi:hypothetical protein